MRKEKESSSHCVGVTAGVALPGLGDGFTYISGLGAAERMTQGVVALETRSRPHSSTASTFSCLERKGRGAEVGGVYIGYAKSLSEREVRAFVRDLVSCGGGCGIPGRAAIS